MGEKYDFDAPRWLDLMLEDSGQRFLDDGFFDRVHPEHERDGLIEHSGLGGHFFLTDLSTTALSHHSYDNVDQSTLSACSHGSTTAKTGHQHVSHRPGRLPRRLTAAENDDDTGNRSNKSSPFLHRLEFSVPEELGENVPGLYRHQSGAGRERTSEESLPDPELFAILTAHNSKVTHGKKSATKSRESGNMSASLISHNQIYSGHKVNRQVDANKQKRKSQRILTSTSPSAMPPKEKESSTSKKLSAQIMLKPASTKIVRQGKPRALRGMALQPSAGKENAGRSAAGAQRLGQSLATAPAKPTGIVTVKTLGSDNLPCLSAGRALRGVQCAEESVASLRRPQLSHGKEQPIRATTALKSCTEASGRKLATAYSLELSDAPSDGRSDCRLKMVNNEANCKKDAESLQWLHQARNGKDSVERVTAHRPPLHDKNHQTHSLSKPNQAVARAIQDTAPNTPDPDDDYLKSLLAWHNSRVIKPSHRRSACSSML